MYSLTVFDKYLYHIIELVDGIPEGGDPDLSALIAQLHAEQLAFPFGVAPRLDGTLVHDSRFYHPSGELFGAKLIFKKKKSVDFSTSWLIRDSTRACRA